MKFETRFKRCSIGELFDVISEFPIIRLGSKPEKYVLFSSIMMIPASKGELIHANHFSDNNGVSCSALIHAKIMSTSGRVEVLLHTGDPLLLDTAISWHVDALAVGSTYVIEIDTYKQPQSRYHFWQTRRLLFCTSSPTTMDMAPTWIAFVRNSASSRL